jgi:isoleucyl-tRNA synthetase
MAQKSPKKSKSAKHQKSTFFRPVFLEDDFSLPRSEEKVLAFWNNHGIFEKSVAKNAPKNKNTKAKEFIFYEGPPTANGRPGVHHILSRAFKDIIPRYKTMQGFYVPRKGGWDTHGLPVEIQVEKQLGLKSKKEIEQYGVAEFNKKCRESVWEFKDEWERMTKRMGFWLDLKNPYITYEPEYMETLWWIIAQFWRKKFLYKGHRVVPWCPRCGTALSSHELAQGYKEVTDNSVYVKFHLKPGQQFGTHVTKDAAYVLSWTTTPWTLPGNVALAMGEKISYTALRAGGTRELYIVASDLVKTVFKDQDVEIVHHDISGKDLLGLKYEPLFDVKPLQKEKSYQIYQADFVTTTDGTGVVHTAVMYGEDDYALGKKIGLPEHHTVSEDGKFTKDVPGFEGLYVKSKGTEEKIFEHLKQNGNFLRTEEYKHEYPHCWRCGTPILYYARTSWFVAMSKLRKQLIASNKTINWIPGHIKGGRFGEWLKEAKDWNFSRERYWGTPLPIWECRDCGHTAVVDSIETLSDLAGGSRNNYWVMRHGEAESNLFNIIDSGERKYLHLTPRGKKQVLASITKFKHALAKKKMKLDMIVASDVTRTHETEEIDASVFAGEKVLLDKRLEEIHLGPTLAGYRDGKYGKDFPTYKSRFETRPEGGESLRDVRTRVWDFLAEYEKKYQGKNILIVTHEYPAWMLFASSEGWSEKRAIAEKEKLGEDFLEFAGIRRLDVRNVSRNVSGEIDLHKPYIDRITIPCKKCGAVMRRVPEVADVWYDSGAMPFAQGHWPFEGNRRSMIGDQKHPAAYPADYISEAVDQTRGWFYTLLAIATLLGYGAPYKNVICLGHINDKHGQKMSKSKGNVVDPWMVMDAYGVDAVRWYFYTATPPGEPKNFDEAEVGKVLRKVHLIVYNSFVFWKTYAKKDRLTANRRSPNVLDRWILARLNELTAAVAKKLDHYEVREAALEIEAFIDDLSRWYIRRSRRRLQRPESKKDHEAASATLRVALFSLVKMMAPFTPFFSEALYGSLGGNRESVHLDEWPRVDQKTIDKKLIAGMASVRELSALGLAKRAEAGIKVRQPLASMTIGVKLAEDLGQILADEVNVKKILFNKKAGNGVLLDAAITPALRAEGIRRDVSRMTQEFRQKAGLRPKDRISVFLVAPEEAVDAIRAEEKIFLADIGAKSIFYSRSEKFDAEELGKWEGKEIWIGIRKI